MVHSNNTDKIIDDLVEALADLRLQRRTLRDEQESLLVEENRVRTDLGNLRRREDVLRDREDCIIQRLQAIISTLRDHPIELSTSENASTGAASVSVSSVDVPDIVKGSRIRIINRIDQNRLGRRATMDDRLGTVTRVKGDRIYFVTDAGTTTYRLRKNVALVD
jgi:hypothetical protein